VHQCQSLPAPPVEIPQWPLITKDRMGTDCMSAWAQLIQNAPQHNWHFAQPWLSNIEADEWIGQRREVDQAIVYEQGKTCVITLVLSCASLCCQAWTKQISSVLADTLHALPYFQVTWVEIRNKHRVRRQHATLPRIMKNLLPSTTTAFC
jgi:hypothetical protein